MEEKNKKVNDDSTDGPVTLRKIRTLDLDIKEYKKNVEKYGEDHDFSYDPYLSSNTKEKTQEQNVASEPEKPEEMLREETTKENTENKKELKKNKQNTSGDDEEDEEEENIPFIELLKDKKKKKHKDQVKPGEEAPVYNIRIPQNVIHEDKPKKQDNKAIVKEAEKPVEDKPLDDEDALRQINMTIATEYAEWKQKLEYYQKNQSKVLEEREDFILNKEDIEKMLKPILESEKALEAQIKIIENKEELLKDEDQKRILEKERWEKEDQRQKLEREKWAHMEELDAALKLISEKDRTYETLVFKQNEAKAKIIELEKMKETAEARVRLKDISRLKVDIEANKAKLENQIKNFEQTVDRFNKLEKSILLEKRAVDEREHQTTDSAEEKIMESKRWEMEDRLRKVEQERWQAVDKQKRLLEIMKDIKDQYEKILKEEKENLLKISDKPAK